MPDTTSTVQIVVKAVTDTAVAAVKKFDAAMDAAGKTAAGFGKDLASGWELASNAVNKAQQGFAKFKQAMDLVVDGGKLKQIETSFGDLGVSVERFRKAADGSLSSIKLMTAANTNMRGDFALSRKEMELVFQAADNLSDKGFGEMDEIVGKLTDGLRGKTKGLKDLGIAIDTTIPKQDQWNQLLKDYEQLATSTAPEDATAKRLDHLSTAFQDAGDRLKIRFSEITLSFFDALDSMEKRLDRAFGGKTGMSQARKEANAAVAGKYTTGGIGQLASLAGGGFGGGATDETLSAGITEMAITGNAGLEARRLIAMTNILTGKIVAASTESASDYLETVWRQADRARKLELAANPLGGAAGLAKFLPSLGLGTQTNVLGALGLGGWTGGGGAGVGGGGAGGYDLGVLGQALSAVGGGVGSAGFELGAFTSGAGLDEEATAEGGFNPLTAALGGSLKGAETFMEAAEKVAARQKAMLGDITTAAGATFSVVSSALTASVDAAITGSKSIAAAAKMAAAGSLRSIAVEAIGQSAKHGAMAIGALAIGGPFGGASAAQHGKAAAAWLGVAALTGSLAAGLGAGAMPSSGGSGGYAGGSSVGSGGYLSTGSGASQAPIVINVNAGPGASGQDIADAVVEGLAQAGRKNKRTTIVTASAS